MELQLSHFDVGVGDGGAFSFPRQRETGIRKLLALHEVMFAEAKVSAVRFTQSPASTTPSKHEERYLLEARAR
ncbi:hypothetical protein [Bradyrhizobium sp.]